MFFSKRTKFSVRRMPYGTGLAGMAVCLLLLAAGCGPPGKRAAELEKQIPQAPTAETATLALKFTPQDSTTYKVITESRKSVEFGGSLPDKADFQGGSTGDRTEMTFTSQIQSIDDQGNAAAKITIKDLKYLSIVKDHPVLDFDSSREKDKNSPLANLIGQSYTIKITPAGRVLEVIDVAQARAAVRGSASIRKAALTLLKPDVIKERHTIPALPAADKNQLPVGGSWSSLKNFSFDMMGSKSYEKIYTLKEIKRKNGRKIAVVEMDAIPTSEMAEQLHKEQPAISISKMFDNTETYTGQLKLDLTAGKVEKCLEKLLSEWVLVDPSMGQKDEEGPATLKMSAVRLYSLEKID